MSLSIGCLGPPNMVSGEEKKGQRNSERVMGAGDREKWPREELRQKPLSWIICVHICLYLREHSSESSLRAVMEKGANIFELLQRDRPCTRHVHMDYF